MPAAVAVVAAVAGGAAGTAVGGMVAAAIGTGMMATVASVAAGVIVGAVVGAVAGGIVGAVTGQDIGESMKIGALSGGFAGGIGGFGAAQASGSMGGDVASLKAAEANAGIAQASEVATIGGEIEAGTGLISEGAPAMNDATSIALGKTSGVEAVQKTTNLVIENGGKDVGGLISKTSGVIKNAAGKLLEGASSEKGFAAMTQLGGSMLEGAGAGKAAELEAEAKTEAATTLYERSKKKLQSGVNPNTPKFSLLGDEWDKSSANPENVAAVAPVAMTPKPKEFTNYKASLDQGLLNA